jgi:hypothetical protein
MLAGRQRFGACPEHVQAEFDNLRSNRTLRPRCDGWRSPEERAVSDRSANAVSFTRTLRLKVRAEAYSWLNAAAIEVNAVWNWANATSVDAADRNRRANAKWLSGFDLCSLSAGASECFEKIGADTSARRSDCTDGARTGARMPCTSFRE